MLFSSENVGKDLGVESFASGDPVFTMAADACALRHEEPMKDGNVAQATAL